MAATVIRNFIAKALFKKKGAIANNKAVEFSANALEERLRRVGIDPNAIQNENQLNEILSAVKQAEDQAFQQRFGDMLGGSKFDRKGEVFDMSGKKLDSSRGIMGGTQVDEKSLKEGLMKTDNPFSDLVKTTEKGPKTLKEREAEVLARMNRENKEAAQRIRDRKRLEDRAIEDFVDDAGGVNPDDPRGIDDFIPDPEDMAQGGRAGFKTGLGKRFLELLKRKKTKPKGDKIYGVGGKEIDVADLKKSLGLDEATQKKDMEDLERKLQMIIGRDRTKHAIGGRAGYKFGLGPLLKSMNKTSPQQAYKKYLQSVKDRAKKGDMKSLAPELSAVAASGIFINRRMQDVLKNMKEKDMENSLENFRKELNSDPFYNKYPELKDKVLENYTEKMFGEKRADGGRIGFKDGMTRRTFLKILGGMAAIPIVGKFLKPLKTAKGVKKVPMIATDNVPGKPEWFDQLVNKVILEGDDVTKKFATGERQSIHQKTLDDGSVVRVTEDVDDGAVRVEYDSADNVFEDTVQMEYKKPLPDEGAPNPAAEFTTAESGPVGRQVGPDDFDIDVDEVGGSSIRDLDSDVSKLKQYATGKGPTMEEIVKNKKRRDRAKAISEDPEAQSDAIIRRQGDYDPSDYDDYAAGGIARMLGE